MKITPFLDKIVVRKLKPKKSIIIDPFEEDRIPNKGVVVAFNKVMNPDCFVTTGDVVVFGVHVGERLPDSNDLFVIMEGDIWCKIDGNFASPEGEL